MNDDELWLLTAETRALLRDLERTNKRLGRIELFALFPISIGLTIAFSYQFVHDLHAHRWFWVGWDFGFGGATAFMTAKRMYQRWRDRGRY